MIESVYKEEVGVVSRRGLLKYLVGFSVLTTIAGVLTPILGYLWPPSDSSDTNAGGLVLAGSVQEYPEGVGKVLSVDSKPVIVVNTERGFKAYSAICTHLGCVVLDKEPGLGYIKCPCHDGRFNPLNGAVIGGPPPRPLPAYEVRVDGDQIYVGGPLGDLYGA